MKDAACKGHPLEIFFPDGEKPMSEALDLARSYCDTCPVRVECFLMAMEAEDGESADYRAGIYAGTTPQQRHAFDKRKLPYGCGKCGQAYDPVELRRGQLHCGCDFMKVPVLPDRGDQWTERHTKLARMALNWFIHHVDDGAEVPDALSLSRTLKVGVKDMRRVYQALREDLVIKRTDTGKLILRGTPDIIERWLPRHLRPKA